MSETSTSANTTETKLCHRCLVVKPVDEFSMVEGYLAGRRKDYCGACSLNLGKRWKARELKTQPKRKV